MLHTPEPKANLIDRPLEPLDLDMVGHYVDYFLSLPGAARLVQDYLLTTVNGITKTIAAWRAILHYGDFSAQDANVRVISYGEGCWPTVSAFIVGQTNWQCASIDPRMDKKWLYRCSYGNLYCARESANITEPIAKLVVLSINAHIDMMQILSKLPTTPQLVVAIPCCVKQEVGHMANYRYIDHGIAKGRNEVLVWKTVSPVYHENN